MNNLICIENLSKIFVTDDGDIAALNNVCINIDKGDFVAITGTSGSGKSTLMNILGCLETPTQGKYFLDQTNVGALNDNQLSDIRNNKIGFIFQSFNLIPGLTACENVELPLLYRNVKSNVRKQLAISALEKVGLYNRVKHLPSQMSGGQQQRVAIARAIAARPPIILADEPTGNLDQKSTNEILSILLELNKEGKTIVLITHDNNVAKMAKRVICIADGKII
ncbi:MAG: ABC transporter ATP-binding protein [Oscillospiraceae bacterium]